MRRVLAAVMITTVLNAAACAHGPASPSASPSRDERDIPGIGRIEPGGFVHAPVAGRILDGGTADRLRRALAVHKPITAWSPSTPPGPDIASATMFLSDGTILGGGQCQIFRTSVEVRHKVAGTTRLSAQAATAVTDTGSHAYAYSWSRNVLCSFNVLSVHMLEAATVRARLARKATRVLALAGVRLIETGAR